MFARFPSPQFSFRIPFFRLVDINLRLVVAFWLVHFHWCCLFSSMFLFSSSLGVSFVKLMSISVLCCLFYSLRSSFACLSSLVFVFLILIYLVFEPALPHLAHLWRLPSFWLYSLLFFAIPVFYHSVFCIHPLIFFTLAPHLQLPCASTRSACVLHSFLVIRSFLCFRGSSWSLQPCVLGCPKTCGPGATALMEAKRMGHHNVWLSGVRWRRNVSSPSLRQYSHNHSPQAFFCRNDRRKP